MISNMLEIFRDGGATLLTAVEETRQELLQELELVRTAKAKTDEDDNQTMLVHENAPPCTLLPTDGKEWTVSFTMPKETATQAKQSKANKAETGLHMDRYETGDKALRALAQKTQNSWTAYKKWHHVDEQHQENLTELTQLLELPLQQ